MTSPDFFDRGDGIRLAYHHRPGTDATVVFLPGYMSDMTGSKALALDAWAATNGRTLLRLDYSGCGASEGRFEDGTISRWRDDVLALVDAVAPGPLLLVGSSMGGWVALLVAQALGDRVVGLVGIAAAPDFTDWGLALTDAERVALAAHGRIERPSDYGDGPYIYTRALIEDGQRQRLLGRPVAIDAPVRLLHGQGDDAVPWQIGLDIAAAVRSSDVQVTFIKDGDHRLSRPADIDLLLATVAGLLESH
ncbi:alpha/beta hydrolase [Polymorphobacter arshaanensis]|uniref:Palmitoyl-protein thioesterase ABHD10, mitochondrial n=1 Tax=Glacieibacterium arshaanense TaxID=2511025 RepID=A0A4Y9EK64_9SPHN|nr:alpha/beta hydrolase [Polymorphobacter arshaanensis]TFU01154.1 alpha/beta hydrolase [Polymorphobacter arshaanensis]